MAVINLPRDTSVQDNNAALQGFLSAIQMMGQVAGSNREAAGKDMLGQAMMAGQGDPEATRGELMRLMQAQPERGMLSKLLGATEVGIGDIPRRSLAGLMQNQGPERGSVEWWISQGLSPEEAQRAVQVSAGLQPRSSAALNSLTPPAQEARGPLIPGQPVRETRGPIVPAPPARVITPQAPRVGKKKTKTKTTPATGGGIFQNLNKAMEFLNTQIADQPMPLPDKPSSANLVTGQTYVNPNGVRAKWNGTDFDEVK